jgi:hypothetical protein
MSQLDYNPGAVAALDDQDPAEAPEEWTSDDLEACCV